MHLKRGGLNGETFAAISTMEGEPWLAILNLHQDTTKVRNVQCLSEMDAIEVVESWLDGVLAGS